MTEGADTLHIRFSEGVRLIKFKFKEMSVTNIDDVHPATGKCAPPPSIQFKKKYALLVF